MIRTQTPAQPSAARRAGPVAGTRLASACERAVDVAVVVLCTWTLVYHLCLVLRLGAPWAVGFELVALCGCALWSRRGPWSRQGDPEPAGGADLGRELVGSSRVERLLLTATAVPAVVAAVLVAADAAWPVTSALWLTAAGAGTALAVSRLRTTGAPADTGERADDEGRAGDDRGRRTRTGVVVALAWATALAVLSTLTRWPNPDDLYYVNLSQWVVDHGTFPVRDTIFSDLAFPMSSWPPIASYDALAGTLALLSGVPAASVVYLVVPPVATFLSVLALWRLLQEWRVRAVGVALSVALVFLLFDGGSGYAAPGNLFLTRIWQGKVILLCLMVPVLLVYALRYAQRPSAARAGWLFAGGVAAVGLSTTAMFLVPLLAVAGAAPLCLRHRRQALLGFAAMAAYPLAAGVLTLVVGGRSADVFDTRRLFRFDPAWFGHEIFRDGPLAAIAVVAVLGGALLIPQRAARVTTGVLALCTGVTLVPGFTQLTYDLVGLGPTLWRVSWVVTIAALVGVLADRLAAYPSRPRLRLVGPAALALVLVVSGLPIWSPDHGISVDATPQWKRGLGSVVSAQRALDVARPGDVILAPEQLSITITVMTTRVKTVAPRDYFMDYLRDDPEFHYDERLVLVDFANGDGLDADRAEVARALTLLEVDQVCLPVEAVREVSFVRSQGYEPSTSTATDACFAR